MGRRGPKPAPNVLKLLRGNPGKRPINQEEPVSRLEIPNPPWELEPDVKKEWDKLCEELDNKNHNEKKPFESKNTIKQWIKN